MPKCELTRTPAGKKVKTHHSRTNSRKQTLPNRMSHSPKEPHQVVTLKHSVLVPGYGWRLVAVALGRGCRTEERATARAGRAARRRAGYRALSADSGPAVVGRQADLSAVSASFFLFTFVLHFPLSFRLAMIPWILTNLETQESFPFKPLCFPLYTMFADRNRLVRVSEPSMNAICRKNLWFRSAIDTLVAV